MTEKLRFHKTCKILLRFSHNKTKKMFYYIFNTVIISLFYNIYEGIKWFWPFERANGNPDLYR